MISQCMNPECRRELRYLRDGRVVRVVARDQKQVKVEHFWLCGACLLEHDFHFSSDGHVSVARRSDSLIPERAKSVDLTLVA
jgi:hypothetical protein